MTDDGPRRWPADSHVHSEWSWDAPYASMELACRRAIDLGLPSIAFTEHLDFTARWLDPTVAVSSWQAPFVTDGLLTPPPLDMGGYRENLDRCRTRFPGLRILSGVEIGEPHLHGHRLGPTIAGVPLDRVLVSMHTLPSIDGGYTTVDAAFQSTPAAQVLRMYLGEVRAMVETFDQFDVLAHLDYAARYWPAGAGPYIVEEFQEEYCAVLTILSAQGKALEVNTRGPMSLSLLRWWYQLGGGSITFASDAHRPEQVARGFPAAVALAEAAGFAPGAVPHGVWRRDSTR